LNPAIETRDLSCGRALLDSHGRVIEARFKPQTLAQLRQLVKAANRAS
jgi:hypothetical protein